MPEGYLIRAKQKPGFRRCGRYFSAEGTVITKTELEPALFARLKAEPMLIIEQGDFTALAEKAEVENTSPDALEEMIEVIGMLDANRDEEDWSKDGKPKVEAIEGLLNQDISAAQRNEAWKIYQTRVK
ncbi:hypothetical protein [Spartinivicinus ruber]|uniref:hypothetical protein n=1 Tax=Spartinivicinus ruber TaxID=2683272 RepID=UPI0013D1DB2B|nr:hypothetical protein [Spartinivicinus ruber]